MKRKGNTMRHQKIATMVASVALVISSVSLASAQSCSEEIEALMQMRGGNAQGQSTEVAPQTSPNPTEDNSELSSQTDPDSVKTDTTGSVNSEFDMAIEAARTADAAGDTAGCREALTRARAAM
jgi:hypothetical protein